jgi:RNA polymerase sigma-70 factor (ECF subfamily)
MGQMEAAYNLAFWIARSRPDAEDIVQEAYLRAFRGFPGFRGEDFRPWLLAIVRNTAYRWLNTQRKLGNVISLDDTFAVSNATEESSVLMLVADEPTAEEMLIRRSEEGAVMHALSELPPIFREIVVLREIEGLSYRALAEITGTEIGTVMSRLSRARAELRKALNMRNEKDEPGAM